jgi:hypothetical protein
MNTTQEAQATADGNPQAATCKHLVDTLAGLGHSWAAFGLKIGKTALSTGVEALVKSAETLDILASTFEKKAVAHSEAAEKSAAEKAAAEDKAAAENKAAPAEPPAASPSA